MSRAPLDKQYSPFGTSLFGTKVMLDGGELSKKWLAPPFSVFDVKQGYWRKRKEAWMHLGIQSELGRGENIVPNGTVRDPANDGAWQRGYNANPNPLGLSSQLEDYRKGRGEYEHGEPPPKGLTFTGNVAEFDHYRRIEKEKSVEEETYNPAGSKGLTWRISDVAYYRKSKKKDPAYNPAFSSQPQLDAIQKQRASGRVKQTASHKGGLVFGMTPGPYDDRKNEEIGAVAGTSIFDPVLCELLYTWFSPIGGVVLDPFAGGSVRGIVAAMLDRRYVGFELSGPQIAANREQAVAICGTRPRPQWIHADAATIPTAVLPGFQSDFVMTCPPYGNLEKYSDDPRDLSAMSREDFNQVYFEIIAASCATLANDRFAAIVVGDYRLPDGTYARFPDVTINAFEAAGLRLYNQAVLVTMIGSLPVRTSAQFKVSRKLGNTHQYVYVFVKGDPRAASDACGLPEEEK